MKKREVVWILILVCLIIFCLFLIFRDLNTPKNIKDNATPAKLVDTTDEGVAVIEDCFGNRYEQKKIMFDSNQELELEIKDNEIIGIWIKE